LALGGGEWSATHLGCLITRERTLVSIEQESGWAAALVWTFWRREILSPSGSSNP
jgi:hypothetical protein